LNDIEGRQNEYLPVACSCNIESYFDILV